MPLRANHPGKAKPVRHSKTRFTGAEKSLYLVSEGTFFMDHCSNFTLSLRTPETTMVAGCRPPFVTQRRQRTRCLSEGSMRACYDGHAEYSRLPNFWSYYSHYNRNPSLVVVGTPQ